MKFVKASLFFVSVFIAVLTVVSMCIGLIYSASGIELSRAAMFITTAIVSAIATYLFAAYDRSELNKTTRQFYKDNRVLHNSIYTTIIALTALTAIMVYGFKSYSLAAVILVIFSIVYIVSLFVALKLRIDENSLYGLIFAISWMTGAVIIVLNPVYEHLLINITDNTILVKILFMIIYVVFFYIGVRKQ